MNLSKEELKILLYLTKAFVPCEALKGDIDIYTINHMADGALDNYETYKDIEKEHGKIDFTVFNLSELTNKIAEAIEE